MATGTGTLEIFFISADISTQAYPHDAEIYVALRCNKELKFIRIVEGQYGGRPIWKGMLTFGIQQLQDSSKDFLIDVCSRSSPPNEFLGSASIPLSHMLGKEVTQTCTLISPSKVEIGKLRIDCKWKPGSQVKGKDQDFGDTKERGHPFGYPNYQYPPPGGYYPSQPAYPSYSYGYPPTPHHGYPPAPHGFPPTPHGYYPHVAHGYPPPHAYYPPTPHSYPSAPIYAPHGMSPFKPNNLLILSDFLVNILNLDPFGLLNLDLSSFFN